MWYNIFYKIVGDEIVKQFKHLGAYGLIIKDDYKEIELIKENIKLLYDYKKYLILFHELIHYLIFHFS